jgi:hypothetical protein
MFYYFQKFKNQKKGEKTATDILNFNFYIKDYLNKKFNFLLNGLSNSFRQDFRMNLSSWSTFFVIFISLFIQLSIIKKIILFFFLYFTIKNFYEKLLNYFFLFFTKFIDVDRFQDMLITDEREFIGTNESINALKKFFNENYLNHNFSKKSKYIYFFQCFFYEFYLFIILINLLIIAYPFYFIIFYFSLIFSCFFFNFSFIFLSLFIALLILFKKLFTISEENFSIKNYEINLLKVSKEVKSIKEIKITYKNLVAIRLWNLRILYEKYEINVNYIGAFYLAVFFYKIPVRLGGNHNDNITVLPLEAKVKYKKGFYNNNTPDIKRNVLFSMFAIKSNESIIIKALKEKKQLEAIYKPEPFIPGFISKESKILHKELTTSLKPHTCVLQFDEQTNIIRVGHFSSILAKKKEKNNKSNENYEINEFEKKFEQESLLRINKSPDFIMSHSQEEEGATVLYNGIEFNLSINDLMQNFYSYDSLAQLLKNTNISPFDNKAIVEQKMLQLKTFSIENFTFPQTYSNINFGILKNFFINKSNNPKALDEFGKAIVNYSNLKGSYTAFEANLRYLPENSKLIPSVIRDLNNPIKTRENLLNLKKNISLNKQLSKGPKLLPEERNSFSEQADLAEIFYNYLLILMN